MDENKEKELAATILANKFKYVAKDSQVHNLLVECTSSVRLDGPLYVIFLDNQGQELNLLEVVMIGKSFRRYWVVMIFYN